jgi:ADP-heptose:LPS heptosyltransferase
MRPADAGYVLCVRLDSMGDVLLTGGAVRAVARAADQVTMLVAPSQVATAALLPGVDHALGFEAPWVPLEPGPFRPAVVRRLVGRLRRRRIDTALIFTSFHQSPLPIALLLRMAGVRWIGAISEDYPGSLLDLRHRLTDDVPEAERGLSLAVAAGFEPDDWGARLAVRQPLPKPPLWLPPAPYVVVHPGAAVPARRPSPIRSAAMVAALRTAGWSVVVTGSRAETRLTAEVAAAGGIDAGGQFDLAGLASILAGAAVVVVPNTGPAHLAAAVGTPVVSLFAPVVPSERWLPYGVPTVRLGDPEAACRLSRARVCPVPGHPCLDSIRPEEVVNAVETLIHRRRRLPDSPTRLTAGGKL